MSISNLVKLLETYQWYIALYFVAILVLTVIFTKVHVNTEKKNGTDYILSTLIYAVSVPGIFSVTLLFYGMFLSKMNMLQVNIIIYFFPIIAMLATFFIISGKVNFKRLPGFEKLWSLMVMIALVFLVIFFLYRLRFFIGFFRSLSNLLFIGVILFIVFRVAAGKISK